MQSQSVQAVLSAVDKGYTSKMNSAIGLTEDLEGASNKTSTSIMDIAKGAGAFKVVSIAADTLKQSLSSAVDRFDTLNQYPKVMQNLGYTTEDASASLDKLSAGIQGVPTALDDAATYTKQWALSTGDLEKATDLYLAINDGAIAYGASAEQAASVQEQLNQMISAGTFDLQSWKIIQQNCPGLLDAVAQSILGESAAASDLRTALNDGVVTTEQFESTLISLDQNGTSSVTAFSEAAQAASGGISTSVTNMKTAVVRGMENIIRTTNDALESNGIPGFQGMIEEATSGIDTAFSIAAGGIELFVGNLDILIPVLGTATAGFVAYKAAMDVSDRVATLKKAMDGAKETIAAMQGRTQLATQSTIANEKAERAMALAETMSTRAREASERQIKAETAAKELSTQATKVKKEADNQAALEAAVLSAEYKSVAAAEKLKKTETDAATAATRLEAAEERLAAANLALREKQEASVAAAIRLRTAEEKAASSATMSKSEAEKALKEVTRARTAADKASNAVVKAQETASKRAAAALSEKAAAESASKNVTEAKKDVDKAAAAVEKARSKAAESGATSESLRAKADELAMKATKAKMNADKASISTTKAKDVAERAETVSTTLSVGAEKLKEEATEAETRAEMVSNVAIAAKTALLGILSGELGVVAAAQMVWNTAMTTNPIGTVIMSATALCAVLAGVSAALKKLDTESAEADKRREETINASEDLIESLESSKDAYEDNVASIKAEASANDELVGKIENLAKKENKSADEKAELQSCVESLNNSMEDLNLQYDAENDALSISIGQIKSKVKAYKSQVEAQAAQERYTEVLKEQFKVEEQLNSIEKDRAALEEEYQDLSKAGPATIGEYNKATAELTEQEEALNAKKKELAESEQYLTDTMEQCQTSQTEAVKSAQQQQQQALAEGIANQTVSLDQLSEANQDTVKSLQDTWQDYADKATDMFDTLSNEQTMSIDEMISNIQKNQEVISQWGDNMELLRDRFANLKLSAAVLDDLADMGPEGAGYVAALASASDEQLQVLAQSFDSGGTIAKESLMESLGVDSNEIPEAIQNMVTQTEETIGNTIKSTDWASIGGDITSGLTDGINEGSEDVATASGNLGTDAENAIRDTTQTHSPSALFESIGQDLVAGLAQGLIDDGTATDAAVQMANNVVLTVQSALEGMDMSSSFDRTFSKIPNVASASMSKVRSTVRAGMSASESAVSSGSSRMQSVMNAGMNSMSTIVKTNMTKMESFGKTGMNQFNSAVTAGMNKAKSNTTSGVAGMVSELSPLQSRFYSSGYYASIGLARGINDGASEAIAAANALANRVAQTMDKALEVGSPSRVTRRTGGYATEGFILGLLDDIRRVRSAAVELSEASIPNGNIASRVAYVGAYSPSVAHDYVGERGAAYTIVVPLEIEGREFARATATYTQEELDQREKLNRYMEGYR